MSLPSRPLSDEPRLTGPFAIHAAVAHSVPLFYASLADRQWFKASLIAASQALASGAETGHYAVFSLPPEDCRCAACNDAVLIRRQIIDSERTRIFGLAGRPYSREELTEIRAAGHLLVPEVVERLLATVTARDEEVARLDRKWREYEDEYVLPMFRIARALGFDLERAVIDSVRDRGRGCGAAELFFERFFLAVWSDPVVRGATPESGHEPKTWKEIEPR